MSCWPHPLFVTVGIFLCGFLWGVGVTILILKDRHRG